MQIAPIIYPADERRAPRPAGIYEHFCYEHFCEEPGCGKSRGGLCPKAGSDHQ